MLQVFVITSEQKLVSRFVTSLLLKSHEIMQVIDGRVSDSSCGIGTAMFLQATGDSHVIY
jgi:hypothetical protein